MSTTSATPKPSKLALGGGMLAAGLIAGAMFSPVGLVGAQQSDDVDDTTEERPDHNGRHGRHHHLGEVLEELGLTAEDVRAGVDADQSLVQIAEANGITEAQLVSVLEAQATEHLAEAVESGRLTQEEADEKTTDLTERITERINVLPSERQERRQERRDARLEPLIELGLTEDDLRSGREAGQTLAETAAAKGIGEEELVAALVAEAFERADDAVESGRATQEEVDERLADVEERITQRVNAEPGERDGRRGGPRGHHHEQPGA